MRLLIVNDENELPRHLAAVLRDSRHPQPLFAACTRDIPAMFATAGLGEGPPIDVLLVDVDPPGGADPEACRKLQEQPPFEDVPLLILTGRPGDQALEAARAAGACD